ncbi:UDP-N-acetylmuramoyl-L-alanyl-D-glutamate--2,6-diaminopimelate ligase [Ornithobacterium rhinotracheale]|uniref:UDP-N-acetylmuramoyl-L-alanyl-D-glutamate--2, 6-diaminopimelate ligase n=1 Tax=Ornithobacterium rhinotracheale TaxID=28251 RepID=UPI00129C97F2|nr:UDP-N-acetylmuramoyl-L-alanyl-D-glutamate--2,6-diaminopimelate ligase [Ornithobacterium rhinotracheale]MRJ09994.1 UDP-N-acetylmuramoyl-L-alanyl-D-glutamate--2,6-diaminopimelate ligase [Ornithobacterium rhinotracheale]
MKLEKLTYQLPIIASFGEMAKDVCSIQFDSRKVEPNDVFVAIVGSLSDGHKFIDSAIEKGAKTIFCQDLPKDLKPEITYIQVKDTSISLGKLAANFYDNPSEKIKLVGITGTNGKTTTTSLLYSLGELLGYPCALISTIEIKIHKNSIPSERTTPDILKINEILAQAVEEGCEYAFMEVSSHGIDQHRIEGLKFSGAGFTNITHDHLDYHKTFKNYLEVKKRFFDDLPKSAFAITNLDDKNGEIMLQNTKAKKIGYALKTEAPYKAKVIENQLTGMLLTFNNKEVWTSLVGNFNAYNLLLVYAIAGELGWNKDEVLVGISQLKNVNGRFQTFQSKGNITIIVDYAHTPDALENVISTIQKIRTKNEKLICVAGCGGDRDKSKRPEMGDAVSELADLAILTSDNPRSEDPEVILAEMEAGVQPQNFRKYLKITDRKEAIKTAINMAESGDIVLIAGKGHENYQEIKGVKHPFDDVLIAKEFTEILNK